MNWFLIFNEWMYGGTWNEAIRNVEEGVKCGSDDLS